MNYLNKRIVQAAVMGGIVLSLAGCGKKEVKVDVNPIITQTIKNKNIEFIRGDLYQLPDDAFAVILQASRSVNAAKDAFRDIDSLAKIEFNNLDNDKIKEIALSEKETLLTSYKNIDAGWKEHIQQQQQEFAPQLAAKKSVMDQAKANLDQYQAVITDQQKAYDQAEQAVKQAKQNISDLFKKYTELTNKDIIDQSLPIHTYNSSISFRYNSRRAKSATCPRDTRREVDGFVFDDTCYYLLPAQDQLLNTPSYKQGKVLFAQYLKVEKQIGNRYRPAEGTLNAQLSQAKDALDNAKIVADNKFGRFYQLERTYNQAKRDYSYVENRLNREISDSQKSQFVNKQLLIYWNQTARRLNQELSNIIQEQMDHVRHDDDIEFGESIDIDPKMKHSLLTYQFKENGHMITQLFPFSATRVLQQKEPTLMLGYGFKIKTVRGVADIRTQQAQDALLSGH
ncbi:hypothetical protein [Celerinatantimonas sp. YJH-8]|uniref:hypothetical protein n=1 Tax=Celerinatantimonas sp. YJH-8 TaxID=3228714 RepID=UPI0038C230B2